MQTHRYRGILAVLGSLALLLALLFWFRIPAMVQLAGIAGAPEIAPGAEVDLAENERWVDDYYAVEQIDENTFAISEPRYFRDVYMYLLVGSERALLIDSGSPNRDPSNIVARLTDKPVVVIATHLHFDHTGNHDSFERVMMQDVSKIRAQTLNGWFTPTDNQFLGSVEGFEVRPWKVTDWWRPGATIDLGGRVLELIETPGHTPDSISIWDPGASALYMGDYGGDGEIYAFLPNSSLQAYLDSTQGLLESLQENATIYAAHGAAGHAGVPATDRQSLSDLAAALIAMRDGTVSGTGFFPRVYPMNRNTVIWTDFRGPNSMIWDYRE